MSQDASLENQPVPGTAEPIPQVQSAPPLETPPTAEVLTPPNPVEVSKKSNKPKFIIFGVLVLLILAGGAAYYFFFMTRPKVVQKTQLSQKDVQQESKQITDSQLQAQEKRLVGYYQGKLSQEKINEISSGRKVVAAYATQNNITVSDAEVSAKKQQMFDTAGKEKVLKEIGSYGWSDADWGEVLWWQILREKILANFEAYREGEWISLRWDAFSPKLDQATADLKSPLSKKYMEDLRIKVVNKQVKLNEFYKSFNVNNDSSFASDRKYMMQYSGVGADGKYTKWPITTQTKNSDILSKLSFSEVSTVVCDIGACSFYNIVSGSNGAPANVQIQKFLQGDYLI